MERIATPSSSLGRTASLEPLLTVKHVCELLAVSPQTLYRLIQRGELTPIRVSRSPRFIPADVRAHLEGEKPADQRGGRDLSPSQKAFFDRLDEQPERRGGGRIVSVTEIAERRSQSRAVLHARHPDIERRRHQLAILGHMLEKEGRL
jgi:excisionase family DNA binding protein